MVDVVMGCRDNPTFVAARARYDVDVDDVDAGSVRARSSNGRNGVVVYMDVVDTEPDDCRVLVRERDRGDGSIG